MMRLLPLLVLSASVLLAPLWGCAQPSAPQKTPTPQVETGRTMVTFAPKEAYRAVGQLVIVQGTVTNVSTDATGDGARVNLEFGTDFRAVVSGGDRAKFDPPLESYTGKQLRVGGIVESDQGKTLMVLRDPSQFY